MAIGIVDYGIGGIALYKLLREQSNTDIVYLSDTGYTAYGKVAEEELTQRIIDVIQYFRNRGITQIAFACNAASTVIPKYDSDIVGTIQHSIEMVSELNTYRLGIVGGNRTIESNIFQNAFESNGIKTFARKAQILSVRIEAGEIHTPEMENDIEEIFTPLKNLPYILLACTHYPLLSDRISKYTGSSILLDPMQRMAEWIFEKWPIQDGNSYTEWLCTGDIEKMKNASKIAHGLDIEIIEKVTI